MLIPFESRGRLLVIQKKKALLSRLPVMLILLLIVISINSTLTVGPEPIYYLPCLVLVPTAVCLYMYLFYFIKDAVKLISVSSRMGKSDGKEIEPREELRFLRVMENHYKTVRINGFIALGGILLSAVLLYLIYINNLELTFGVITLLSCPISYLLFYYLTDIQRMRFFKRLSPKHAELLAADINLDIPDMAHTDIYCGERAFFASKENLLIAYEDVRWVYVQKNTYKGNYMSSYLIIRTKDGGKYRIGHHHQESGHLIEKYFASSPYGVLIDDTPENERIYNRELQAYYASNN